MEVNYENGFFTYKPFLVLSTNYYSNIFSPFNNYTKTPCKTYAILKSLNIYSQSLQLMLPIINIKQ